MEWEIVDKPEYSVLIVKLEHGETVAAEPGAMILVRGSVSVRTSSGGLVKGLVRRLGGESAFLNYYTAGPGGAEVWLAPRVPGDIGVIDLRGEEWVLQDSAYLAHAGDISLSAAWRGLKGLLSEGNLVWLKASGSGTLWVTSYGSIREVVLAQGEHAIIDNMHFVAMPAGTRYRVRKFGGLKTFFFGGEGLVVEVWGPARVLVQTRNPAALARELLRYR